MITVYAIQPNLEIIRRDYLQTRNYYQRLGFSDIRPTPSEIEKACHARRRMLKDAFDDLGQDEWAVARDLVEEAYDCLIQPHRRRRYDAKLQRNIKGVPKASSLVLSRYQIGQKLYEGDRTTIYEAHDTHLTRDCVIKKINPHLLRNPEHQTLIRREAELFASYNSGHLVKILDFDAPRGIVVLEKMKSDVSSLATPNGMAPHLVYDLMEQALRGLDAMHSEGLAHGRIDYDHLLLDDQNKVKLSVTPGVSGIATALSPTIKTKYVAPEMLNPSIFGTPKVAIDIYALGFVMLELLVGKSFAKKVNPGFSTKEGGSHGWLLWHASPTDHLPSIQELSPKIDSSFVAVLEQMVAKDQNRRFTSASACLAALAKSKNPSVQESLRSGSMNRERNEIHPIGSPDALTQAFQFDRAVSWKQILNQPQLLLSPDGRQHAAILFVGSLVACSVMMVMTGRSPELQQPEKKIVIEPKPESEKVAASPTEHKSEDVTLDQVPEPSVRVEPEPSNVFWQVSFDVIGGGKVVAVDSLAEAFESEHWELLPGEHHATVVNSLGHAQRNFEFTLAQGHGVITVPIGPPSVEVVEPEPIASQTPKPEVEDHKTFPPMMHKLPLLGAANTKKAIQQTALLRHAFKQIRQNPTGQRDKKILPELPAKKTGRKIDPRFHFALALNSYLIGERTKSLNQVEESINNAEHFGVVFMPSIQLYCRIQMRRGNCKEALAVCRSAHSILIGDQNRIANKETSDSMSELAWWAGTLVGVIEITNIDRVESEADTAFTSQRFQENCSPQDWDWFEAGRRRSTDQAIELTSAWQKFRSQREGEMRDNTIRRFNRYRYLKEEAAKDRKMEIDLAQMWLRNSLPFSESSQYGSDDRTPKARVTAEDIVVKPIHRFGGEPPISFNSYVPDDTTILAERAYQSITTPSGRHLVAFQ